MCWFFLNVFVFICFCLPSHPDSLHHCFWNEELHFSVMYLLQAISQQSELSYLVRVYMCMREWFTFFLQLQCLCASQQTREFGCMLIEIWQQKLCWTSVSQLMASGSAVAPCLQSTGALLKAVKSTWLRLEAILMHHTHILCKLQNVSGFLFLFYFFEEILQKLLFFH